MKNFARKVQWVLAFMLIAVPLTFLPGVVAFPQQLWLLCVFAALYLFAACVCLLAHGWKRPVLGAGMAVLIAAAGLWLLPWRAFWWTLSIPAAYAALLLYGLPMSSWPEEQEIPYYMGFAGTGVYAVMQLIIAFRPKPFEPVKTAFLLCFLAYGALMVLSLNRRSLVEAAPRDHRTPQGMRRKNRIFTIGLMGLVLLLSAIPAIGRALTKAWGWLMEGIAAFLRLISSLLPAGATGGGGGGGSPAMLGGAAAEEPGLLAKIMEIVAVCFAALVIVAGVIAALRILWRKLRVLLHKLWNAITRYAQAASEDYVDEVTDTRASNDNVSRRKLLDDWFRRVNEDSLSPVERVRYRYQRLMRRHAEWLPGSTARENLPPDTAGLYEKARYSGQTVTPQEADAFAQRAKAMEKKG